MSKHFSDLSQITDQRLKQDIETWENAWIKAQTKEGEEKAREIVNELWEELLSRQQSA